MVRVKEPLALKCKINAKHTLRCHHRLFPSQSGKRQQIPPLDRVEYQVMLTREVAHEPVPVGYLGYCRFGVLVVELVWTFLFAMVYQLTLGFLVSEKILSQNLILEYLDKNFSTPETNSAFSSFTEFCILQLHFCKFTHILNFGG